MIEVTKPHVSNIFLTYGQTYEVIDFGIINLFSDKVVIHIEELSICLNFKLDDKIKTSRYVIKPEKNNHLELEIVNATHSYFAGICLPLQIGMLNGRELFINFTSMLFTMPSVGHRILVYNLLLGKNIDEK
jgi:hypothetical protein